MDIFIFKRASFVNKKNPRSIHLPTYLAAASFCLLFMFKARSRSRSREFNKFRNFCVVKKTLFFKPKFLLWMSLYLKAAVKGELKVDK